MIISARNAEALERAGAAVVLEETRLDEVWLVDTISCFAGRSGAGWQDERRGTSMAHPDAAKDIAELAAKVAGIQISASDSRG